MQLRKEKRKQIQKHIQKKPCMIMYFNTQLIHISAWSFKLQEMEKCYCIPRQSQGNSRFGPVTSPPPHRFSSACPTSKTICLRPFKFGMCYWVMGIYGECLQRVRNSALVFH